MATILYFRDRMSFEGCQIEAYVTLVTASRALKNNTDDLDDQLLFEPRTRTNLVEMVAKFDEIGVSLYYDDHKHFA